jgi:hypothetical protein
MASLSGGSRVQLSSLKEYWSLCIQLGLFRKLIFALRSITSLTQSFAQLSWTLPDRPGHRKTGGGGRPHVAVPVLGTSGPRPGHHEVTEFLEGSTVPHYALLLAGLLLASPTADPVSYQQEGSRLAAVRVKNWISGYRQPGPTVNGTGTLTAVDGDGGLVLTAAHLFEGEIGPITVDFHDGQSSGARILAIDRKMDVAALWIYAPKGIQPVPIAEHSPALGELVEIWGYGPKRFRSFVAAVADPIPMDGDVPKSLIAAQGVQERQVTIPGDSGGPMIRDGKLVAVHWGYRGAESDPRRCVHALSCDMLRDWLKGQLTPAVWQRCLADSTRAISMN